MTIMMIIVLEQKRNAVNQIKWLENPILNMRIIRIFTIWDKVNAKKKECRKKTTFCLTILNR